LAAASACLALALTPPHAALALESGGGANNAPLRDPTADVAAGLFAPIEDSTIDERDPIEPFVVYGSNFKQYLIEQLDGEKIVARKRGFTVDACTGVVPASRETPGFAGLSPGEKVEASGNSVCRRAAGTELKPACVTACSSSCAASLDAYEQVLEKTSGYRLAASDRARIAKNCQRSCAVECNKSGKAHDFAAPYKR
jgi:hypothetical protein